MGFIIRCPTEPLPDRDADLRTTAAPAAAVLNPDAAAAQRAAKSALKKSSGELDNSFFDAMMRAEAAYESKAGAKASGLKRQLLSSTSTSASAAGGGAARTAAAGASAASVMRQLTSGSISTGKRPDNPSQSASTGGGRGALQQLLGPNRPAAIPAARAAVGFSGSGGFHKPLYFNSPEPAPSAVTARHGGAAAAAAPPQSQARRMPAGEALGGAP